MVTADDQLRAGQELDDWGYKEWQRQQEAEATYWLDTLDAADSFGGENQLMRMLDGSLDDFVNRNINQTWANAYADGAIGGGGTIKARTEVCANMPAPPEKMSISAHNKIPMGGDRQKPPPPAEYQCLNWRMQHAAYVTGEPHRAPVACGQCRNCREWRIRLICIRSTFMGVGDCGVIWANGFADVDAAANWRCAMGRRHNAPRLSVLRRNEHYTWDCVIIYAMPLPDCVTLLVRKAAGRAGISVGQHTRPVSISELSALLPREPLVDGAEKQRRTVVFSDWLNFEEEEETDYLLSDAWLADSHDPNSRPTETPEWAARRKQMPLETRAELNALDWCRDCETLADYKGPTRLVEDTRAWLRMERGWREAFRPMLRLIPL